MSLLEEPSIQTSVYICSFECFIRQANIAMKFPCSYFVEWRTVNSKVIAKTQRHLPNQNTVNFDEKIVLSVQMLYDHNKMQFLNRDTILELFLISKSRPDQHKLVGRVNVDIGKVINVGMYESPTEFKLNFCSVEGTLIMQFKASQRKLTNLTINDLDKSSFIDFMAQKTVKNQSMIHSRNQGHQSKSKEKSHISQVRGISPSSPKANIKQSLFVRADSIRPQATNKQEVSNPQQQRKQSKILGRENDESEAHNKIVPRNNNFFAKNNSFQNKSQQNKVHKGENNHILGQYNTTQPLSVNPYSKLSDKMLENTNKRSAVNPSQNVALLTNIEGRTIKDEIIRFKNAVQFQQKNNAKQQNGKANQQFMQLFNQNMELHKAVVQKQATTLDITNKLKAQRLKSSHYQQQVTNKNAVIEDIQQQLNKSLQNTKRLQLQITKSKNNFSQIETLKRKVSSHQKLIEDSKQQIKKYEQRQIRLLAKIEDYSQQIKVLQRDHEQCLKKINQNLRKQGVMKGKIEQLQIQNNQLVSNLQEAKRQIQQLQHSQNSQHLQQELQNMQANLQKVIARWQNAEKQISEMQVKYFELENQYDQLKASHHATKEQGSHHEDVLQNSEIIEEIMVQSMDNIEQPPETIQLGRQFKEQNQRLLEQIQQLRQNFTSSQAENKLTHDQNESLKKKIMVYQHQLQVFEEINNQLSQTKLINHQLSESIQALKMQINQNTNLWETQAEKYHKQITALRHQNQELKQQTKAIAQQVQFYEEELTSLKNQIIKFKQNQNQNQNREIKPINTMEQKCQEYKQMIDKLNANLQEQINQNNQLSQAIVRYMQKQAKMKETLAVLQKQSKQIFSLVQQKEQNEQTYQKAIDELHAQILRLKDQEQSQSVRQARKDEQQSKKDSRVSQSHNEELLKLQQKLLQQNSQLAQTCNHLKEQNTKLNEELMLACIENNDVRSKLETQLIEIKEKQERKRQQEKMKEQSYIKRVKEKQKIILTLEREIDVCKSQYRDKDVKLQKYEIQMVQLRRSLEQLEEDKFNIQSLSHQKDIKVLELTEQLKALIILTSNNKKQQNTDLNLIKELKESLLSKSWNSDWDSLLQSVLDKSVIGQQTSKLLNLEQKGRMLSKQLQKMKASLLKSEWRNQQQKVATMGLFKKCDIIVGELISCAQSLNQNQSSFL